MPLDFRWLIRPRKKIRPIFLRSTSLLYKIVPTNLGACKQIFYTIYTSHLRWDSTMRCMRHCFYHADRMQYFTILQYKLHSFSIRDDRSTRGLLAKKLKKNQKPPIRPGVCHFCSASCGRVFEKNINRVTLQHNKEFVMYLLMVLSMCNLQKRLIRAAFWVLLQAMFTERLKTNGTAIKITREATNNQ